MSEIQLNPRVLLEDLLTCRALTRAVEEYLIGLNTRLRAAEAKIDRLNQRRRSTQQMVASPLERDQVPEPPPCSLQFEQETVLRQLQAVQARLEPAILEAASALAVSQRDQGSLGQLALELDLGKE